MHANWPVLKPTLRSFSSEQHGIGDWKKIDKVLDNIGDYSFCASAKTRQNQVELASNGKFVVEKVVVDLCTQLSPICRIQLSFFV